MYKKNSVLIIRIVHIWNRNSENDNAKITRMPRDSFGFEEAIPRRAKAIKI